MNLILQKKVILVKENLKTNFFNFFYFLFFLRKSKKYKIN